MFLLELPQGNQISKTSDRNKLDNSFKKIGHNIRKTTKNRWNNVGTFICHANY